MAIESLGDELKALTPDQMIESVKDTSWKIGGRADGVNGFAEEFAALRKEYPGLAAAVDVMIEADVAKGRSREEALEHSASAMWVLLALKSVVDGDELRRTLG